jgi:hypothetical protein
VGRKLKLGNCLYDRVIVGEGCRFEAGPLSFAHFLKDHADFPAPILSSPLLHPDVPDDSATVPIRWTLETHPINSLLLECTPRDHLWFTAQFSSDGPLSPSPQARLLFADDVEEIILNQISLIPESLDNGTSVSIPSEIMRTSNTVLFATRRPVARPFAWLEGTFRVASLSPWSAGPGETVKTEGPIVIRSTGTAIEHDLVTGGFPFLREKLRAVSEIDFPQAAAILRLEGLDACAVRLSVDDSDLGWTWRADGAYRFAGPFAAGRHTMRIELIPNAYNTFGPHHYYNGDWYVVSPDQMRGVRNFADAPGAPESTHVPAWHFRRFRLPHALTLGND